ncbi:MAG: response regulator transcription factor [Suipraeoptans sp.]
MFGRVILVDDNEQYAKSLKTAIEDEGYEVFYYTNPIDAIAEFVKIPFDILISDYKMAEMNGTRLVTILRGINPEIKCMLLTAFPTEEIERETIDINVECYLSKDKSVDLILHYLNDLICREPSIKGERAEKMSSIEEQLVVDIAKHEVFKANSKVSLTRKEFELLILFLQNKGTALSRDHISEKLWTPGVEDFDPRVIDGHVKRLRGKLRLNSIMSVRGYGYKWNE